MTCEQSMTVEEFIRECDMPRLERMAAFYADSVARSGRSLGQEVDAKAIERRVVSEMRQRKQEPPPPSP